MNVSLGKKGFVSIPITERLSQRILVSETGCHIYTGLLNDSGYGTLREGGRNGKTWLAHRLSFTLNKGQIPSGMLVCHSCDVRSCVNPDHLFLGTIQDNNRDRDIKGRCKPGHVPGEKCGQSKLKEDQVIKILKDTRTHKVIAKEYGVCRATITHIKRGLTWRYLLTIGHEN